METPLHLAVRYGNTECAALLIKNGASLQAKDNIVRKNCRCSNLIIYCFYVISALNLLFVRNQTVYIRLVCGIHWLSKNISVLFLPQ